MYSGEDRRMFVRLKGRLVVRCRPEGGEEEFCTSTENISGSGIRIELLKRLCPGTILDMEIFRANSNVSFRCKGEIVWITAAEVRRKEDAPFEAGVKLMHLDLMYFGILIKDLKTQFSATPSLN